MEITRTLPIIAGIIGSLLQTFNKVNTRTTQKSRTIII